MQQVGEHNMSDHYQVDKREIEFCADRLNIEFNNLCYYPSGKKVKSSKQKPVLNNICGKFYSGRLTAILGPSGAGKTSLLNVLAGFKKNGVTGSIKINGRQRNVQKFRKQSSYITQEFAILKLLTTKDTMVFAADLKIDSDVGKEMKNEMIDKILSLLGLEKVMDVPVAKLSGGEKKRLSIGLELLSNPPVMFFDEPTSGLDSSSALQVISHLKSLAEGGRTVVCSIHQPSSQLFQMFDDICVVAEGQCLYSGPVNDLTSVFEEAGFQCPNFYNRADFVIDVACGERGDNRDKLIEKFNAKECDLLECQQVADSEEISMLHLTTQKWNDTAIQICTENEVYAGTSYPQSGWKQFQVLLKRSLMCSLRDKMAVHLRVICHLIIGLLLGALYYDAGNDAAKIMGNISCIFFFKLFLVFANGVPSILSVPLETSVVLREHLNNWYSLEAYYFSKMIADIPLQIICPTVFLLVGYFLTGQPSDGTRFLQFWVLCLLITLISHNLGLAMGAFFKNPEVAMFVLPASNIPLVLFSGFFLNLRDMPKWLGWLCYVSYFRYAFEGSMQCLYGYDRPNLECSQVYCYFKSPQKLLEEFEMENSVYAYDALALLVWTVLLQLSVLIILKMRIHNFQ